MIRTLKLLGVAVVAALALSSVVASMASADDLTAESYPATLTGNEDGVTGIFKVHGGEVKCSKATYTGTVSAATTTVTVTASYGEPGFPCTFAGLASTINMNGCDYLLHIDAEGKTTGSVDIVCEPGTEITVTAPSVGTAKCIVHVPAQPGLRTITGTNIGAGATREITLHINLTGIKYSQTAGTAETGNCTTADNTTDGTLAAKALITGETDPSGVSHIGIFLS